MSFICRSYVIQQRLNFHILRTPRRHKTCCKYGRAPEPTYLVSLRGHILTRQIFESGTRRGGVVLGSIRKLDNQVGQQSAMRNQSPCIYLGLAEIGSCFRSAYCYLRPNLRHSCASTDARRLQHGCLVRFDNRPRCSRQLGESSFHFVPCVRRLAAQSERF